MTNSCLPTDSVNNFVDRVGGSY